MNAGMYSLVGLHSVVRTEELGNKTEGQTIPLIGLPVTLSY